MDNETVQRLQTALKELRENGVPVTIVLVQEKVASGSEIAGADPSEMTQQFFIEEYKALREEIKLRMDETTSLERYFLIASAAVYVWLSAVQLGLDATTHNRQSPASTSSASSIMETSRAQANAPPEKATSATSAAPTTAEQPQPTARLGPASDIQATQAFIFKVAWFIPAAFAVLASIRIWGLRKRLRQIGNYIKAVEEKWRSKLLSDQRTSFTTEAGSPAYGWQGFVAQARGGITGSTIVFWTTSVLSTLAVALFATSSWFRYIVGFSG